MLNSIIIRGSFFSPGLSVRRFSDRCMRATAVLALMLGTKAGASSMPAKTRQASEPEVSMQAVRQGGSQSILAQTRAQRSAGGDPTTTSDNPGSAPGAKDTPPDPHGLLPAHHPASP